MPYLRRLHDGFSALRPGINPGDFKWDSQRTKWHWSKVFSEFFILTLLHIHVSPTYEVCDSPDQAAHYHTLSPTLGYSPLTWHFAGLTVKIVYFLFSVWERMSEFNLLTFMCTTHLKSPPLCNTVANTVFVRVKAALFFDKNLPSKIGVRLIHGI
jgi:hypothetical protein